MHVREPGARIALEAPRGDLGQARQVVGADAEGGLDLRLGRRDGRARLAGVPRDPQLRVLGEIDALLGRRLGQEQRVRRRAAEHGDRVRQQRVEPLLGGEPAHRVHEAAEVLRRVEAAPVADPRAVGERGHRPCRTSARRRRGASGRTSDRSRASPRRVSRNAQRPAGGGGGQVHAQHVGERHRQQVAPRRARGLVFLQLVLGGERQAPQIVERAELRRIGAHAAELSSIERAVAGGVGHLLAQPAELQARHLGAGGALQPGLEIAGRHPVARPAAARSCS